MNLKQDHNKILTDITVAENRIKDLVTRQEILNSSIADILKDKRKIDKYNMELEDKISGRNVTDEMTKKRHKNEERKMSGSSVIRSIIVFAEGIGELDLPNKTDYWCFGQL